MTITEIAKLAGTSRGTVDRVINGRGKVNKELEARIKEIIRENEYEVNGSARALSMSQKKYSVGIVINSVGNPFFARVKQGISERLRARSFHVAKEVFRRHRHQLGGQSFLRPGEAGHRRQPQKMGKLRF